jgi:hypothetical protein
LVAQKIMRSMGGDIMIVSPTPTQPAPIQITIPLSDR